MTQTDPDCQGPINAGESIESDARSIMEHGRVQASWSYFRVLCCFFYKPRLGSHEAQHSSRWESISRAVAAARKISLDMLLFHKLLLQQNPQHHFSHKSHKMQ